MDGNNSLKRVGPLGNRRVADKRVFEESDYYLKSEEVERYAHEVKARRRPPATTRARAAPVPVTQEASEEGDPADAEDLEASLQTCAKNWKNAKSEELKKSWAIYEETGIFAAACRHGLILWIIDMYKSGEL